jgi:hypothetical protein
LIGVPLDRTDAAVANVDKSEAESRYHYITAITHAIESWSADIVQNDRAAFHYRGINLRYAVERALYFMLVNDGAIFALYRGSASKSPRVLYAIESELIPYLLGKNQRSSARRPRGSSWRNWSRRRWQACRSLIANLNRLKPAAGDHEIVFLVIQPKFVRFLYPIANAVGSRAIFVTVDDAATEDFLRDQGLRNLALSPSPAAAGLGVGVLQQFSYFCALYDLFRAFFSARFGSVLVIPEGNAPINEIAALAAAQSGVKTVCIQHGWSPISHPGFRNLHFDDMLVWGDLFAELLSPANPCQRFSVVGTPSSLPMAKEEDAVRPVRGIGFFLQKTGPLIDAADWRAFLDLIRWAAVTFPDVDIVVRDHPSTETLDRDERSRIGDLPNLRFMPPASYSLSEALACSDVVVAAYSTTLLEAIAVGAIPLLFGASGMPHYNPDLASMGVALEEKSLVGAKMSLASLVRDETTRARLRARGQELRTSLFAANGEQAVRRIVERILSAGR